MSPRDPWGGKAAKRAVRRAAKQGRKCIRRKLLGKERIQTAKNLERAKKTNKVKKLTYLVGPDCARGKNKKKKYTTEQKLIKGEMGVLRWEGWRKKHVNRKVNAVTKPSGPSESIEQKGFRGVLFLGMKTLPGNMRTRTLVVNPTSLVRDRGRGV